MDAVTNLANSGRKDYLDSVLVFEAQPMITMNGALG